VPLLYHGLVAHGARAVHLPNLMGCTRFPSVCRSLDKGCDYLNVAGSQSIRKLVSARPAGHHFRVLRARGGASGRSVNHIERTGPSRPNDSIEWLHQIDEAGVVRYRMGRRGDTLVADWPGLARLTCHRTGRGPRLVPSKGASQRALAKLDAVVGALMIDLRGGLGLHASAVAIASKAVLFLGASGEGKSTAAAALCIRHGGRLLADDAALLQMRNGRVRIAPSEATHSLTKTSADALGLRGRGTLPGQKVSVLAKTAAERPCALALVVSLRFDDAASTVITRRLSGAEAARRILSSMFRFDVVSRTGELDRVMRLYVEAPFLEFTRSRSEPDVTFQVLQALQGQ
jgi:hypothetical protein